jgi:HD superfamily phosphodiesterase
LGDREQARTAKLIRGTNIPGNAPFDVHRGVHAIEVKTVMDNKNDKITMHPPSRRRKEAFAKDHKMMSHTVMIYVQGKTYEGEDGELYVRGQRKYYYKAGVGAYRRGGMKEVTIAELRGMFE